MDLKIIKEQFDEIIKYNENIDSVNTDKIFEKWFSSKKRFIDKWGGLVYETKEVVTFDLPDEDKSILFKDFILDAAIFSNNLELKRFLQIQGEDSFYENKVSKEFIYKENKIQVGAKISKSLKLFFDSNVQALETFQIKMSRLIQDCKVSGRLVLSVHPIDFLSSSENVHNWHSCHALDGEYKSGNISYMLDEHTFMVYLKSEKDYKLPNFPKEILWNSKKWRMLLYLSKDENILVRGRQYPFYNSIATDYVDKILDNFYVFDSPWESVAGEINDLMEDAPCSLHYNDCLNSFSYSPVARVNKTHSEEKMIIGDSFSCLSCGNELAELSDSFLCCDCGGYIYCSCCGEACREEDMYTLEGESICTCCWDDSAIWCDNCGGVFNRHAAEMIWNEKTQGYYCTDCYYDVVKN